MNSIWLLMVLSRISMDIMSIVTMVAVMVLVVMHEFSSMELVRHNRLYRNWRGSMVKVFISMFNISFSFRVTNVVHFTFI